MHTVAYRNPDQLKPGGVLIIGSAQSGVQIAEELIEAGRPVYLCTSKVGRSIRQYRGRDVLYWGIAIGNLYQTVADLEYPNMQFAAQGQVSGTKVGHTISLQQLARYGLVLLGGLKWVSGDQLSLRENLVENCDFADGVSQRRKIQIDAFIEKMESMPHLLQTTRLMSRTRIYWRRRYGSRWTCNRKESAPSSGAPASQRISVGYTDWN